MSFVWYAMLAAWGGFNPTPPVPETITALVTDDSEVFKPALVDALSTIPRDYAWLKSFMDEDFLVVLSNSPGESMTPDEAANRLEVEWLPLSAEFQIQPDVDVISLYGQDPKTNYPDVIDYFYSEGWGIQSEAAVILLIAKRQDGSLCWYGIIYNPAGF